uniref:Uncharacterized protein n=1 Tax=Rhizophora mucronata TaxID=61149 RepID=A0A2P2NRP7_RHIMU
MVFLWKRITLWQQFTKIILMQTTKSLRQSQFRNIFNLEPGPMSNK